MTAVESSPAPSMRVYVLVWAMLVLVVAAEVAMTMAHPSPVRLLVALLTLAFVEAAVALLYFMHLRWEPRILFWSLVPALVFVLVMMDNFFPDALRLMHQRLPHQQARVAPMTPHAMHAAMAGMVILVVPAFILCAAIAAVAYRRRGESDDR